MQSIEGTEVDEYTPFGNYASRGGGSVAGGRDWKCDRNVEDDESWAVQVSLDYGRAIPVSTMYTR